MSHRQSDGIRGSTERAGGTLSYPAATAVLAILAVLQLGWLAPATGIGKWVSQRSPVPVEALSESYITYFVLWASISLAVLWLLPRMGADPASAVGRVTAAFPLLLVWDGLFSRHPDYPLRAVNGLLFCWLCAISASLLATKLPSAFAVRLILGALALQAVASVAEWRFSERVSGGLDSPNSFYPLPMFAAVVCTTLALQAPKRTLGVFTALLGLFCLALAASGNRAGMLAALGTALWLVYRLRPDARRCAVVLVVMLLPLSIGWFVRQAQTNLPAFYDRSAQARPMLWQAGLQVAFVTHALGSGVANYQNVQGGLNDIRLLAVGAINVEPKNLPIAMLAIYGLPGLLYLLLLVRAVFSNGSLAPECLSLRASVVSLLLAGIADTPALIAERLTATFLFLQWWMLLAARSSVTAPSAVNWRRYSPRKVLIIGATIGVAIALTVGYIAVRAWMYFPELERVASSRVPALDQYNPTLVQLLILRENRNFWTHHGVDWRGLHRALRTNVRTLQMAQGGSTITQQMVRATVLREDYGSKRSLMRKGIEFILALHAERIMTKEQILQLYLHHAVALAMPPDRSSMTRLAEFYFRKPASSLSVQESAVLAGWVSAPPADGVDWRRTIALRNATLATSLDFLHSLFEPVRLSIRCNEGNGPR